MSFYVSNKHRVCNKSEKNDRCLAIFFTSNSSPKATEELAVRASRASATLVLCDSPMHTCLLKVTLSRSTVKPLQLAACTCLLRSPTAKLKLPFIPSSFFVQYQCTSPLPISSGSRFDVKKKHYSSESCMHIIIPWVFYAMVINNLNITPHSLPSAYLTIL